MVLRKTDIYILSIIFLSIDIITDIEQKVNSLIKIFLLLQ
uniref:Uncharacterized protein n=1 Tax=Siphoviridae sp. ctLqe90 TaxID=2825456 RepID=A0A8S5Q2Z9_9CAUD|nr:MAG TPA: hypothetical protein [Siphoviridae sp. ctLqe90]